MNDIGFDTKALGLGCINGLFKTLGQILIESQKNRNRCDVESSKVKVKTSKSSIKTDNASKSD